MLIKKIVILSILGVSSIFANSLIDGLTDIVDTAEEKKAQEQEVLKNAFKQRMKTQRMARDVLLIKFDFNSKLYQENLLKNGNEFNKKFNNLMADKKDIDKVIKQLPKFKVRVDEFKETWSNFYKNVELLSKDSKNEKASKYIIDNNLVILNDIDYIFSNFLKFYQSTDKLEKSMNHIKSMLFSQVGKPRMYITKIVKERLLVELNIEKKKNQESMKQTIKEMDRLMKALKDGDKGLELNGTEDRKILEKLAISQKIWEELKEVVVKPKLTKKEWEDIILKNEEFIKAQTEVVTLTKASNDT